MPLSANLRGALFMVISMAGFTLNDALSKVLLGSMGNGQLMLVRGIFATSAVLVLAWYSGALAQPRQLLHPMVALRSVCELLSTMTYLAALSHMPLANVSALMQALPLAITVGAALFLGEMVGWRRWLGICIGFTGVMIVVRPGYDGFNVYSLLMIACVSVCAVRDLSTRYIPTDTPSVLVSALTSTIVTIGGGLLIPITGGWQPMTGGDIGIAAAAAGLLLVGYQFIIMSTRVGDVSYIAPFRYTALLWAVLLGYLLFGDVPDTAMIIGAAIIVGSGLYTIYRERRAGRTQPVADTITPSMGVDGL